MRRAAVAVMTAGVVLGVSAAASPGPAASARMVAGRAAPQGTKARAAAPLKTVEFAGYRFDVPASWPVYRLGSRPHQCVRYDKHAVYLGSPGPDQQCPAHLVGRTETIRISGGSGGSGGSRAARSELAGGAQGRAASMAVGGAQGRAGVRNVPGMLVRNAARREFGMTLHRPGLSIVATYGTRPGVVERIIASVRGAPAPAASSARLPLTGPAPARLRLTGPPAARMPVPAPAGSAASTTPGAARSSGPAAPVGAPPAGTSASAGSLTPASAAGQTGSAYVAGAAVGAPAGSASIGGALPGFDTCTAPSLPAMQAWRSAYSVVGIYIGGLNRACDQSNLSVPWVRQVRAMGWLLIPTYVGLQPPCDHFSAKIDPKRAAAEATGAANSAVAHALALGLRRGAPIYFDMEGYKSKRPRCRNAVLTFLDAWTRQLHARHFVSGVYSSAGSGVEDLGNTGAVAGHTLAEPDSIWFALWDGHGNLLGSPYMLSSWWPQHRRIKQFRGGRWQKHGRFRLNIDRDWVFGAVY